MRCKPACIDRTATCSCFLGPTVCSCVFSGKPGQVAQIEEASANKGQDVPPEHLFLWFFTKGVAIDVFSCDPLRFLRQDESRCPRNQEGLASDEDQKGEQEVALPGQSCNWQKKSFPNQNPAPKKLQ